MPATFELHDLYAKLNGDFKKQIGKLYIHKYYNEVCGNRLEVAVINGNEKLYVYGLNDGHRGCGWIHYNVKIENDLLDILKEELDKQNKKYSESESKRIEEQNIERLRVEKILSSY